MTTNDKPGTGRKCERCTGDGTVPPRVDCPACLGTGRTTPVSDPEKGNGAKATKTYAPLLERQDTPYALGQVATGYHVPGPSTPVAASDTPMPWPERVDTWTVGVTPVPAGDPATPVEPVAGPTETPYRLWKQANGNAERYGELLVEHGWATRVCASLSDDGEPCNRGPHLAEGDPWHKANDGFTWRAPVEPSSPLEALKQPGERWGSVQGQQPRPTCGRAPAPVELVAFERCPTEGHAEPVEALRQALADAMVSLETASNWKRGEGSLVDAFYDLRGFANSRANVAREALRAYEAGKGAR